MISRRNFLAGCLPAALSACSTSELINTIEAAARGGSITGAIRNVATNKAYGWARNPKSLLSDMERLDQFAKDFVRDIASVWGEENSVTPTETVMVKYSDAYKTRSIIDFEKGIVRVETLNPFQLKQAIVMTVLSPEDPQAIELFNASPAQLKGEPFLYGQVLDQDQKAIRWQWRADRFADYLIKQKKTRSFKGAQGENLIETYVEFPLVRQHVGKRQLKYSNLVRTYSKTYGQSEALVYAIIQTESNFNPYAVSWVPAYGLMQIVPTTAGRDAYQVVHGRAGTPDRNYLFDAKNNIRMGCAYLNLLENRYLANVKNSLSREYCVIAGYNGGAGNVLRSFHRRRTQAFATINASTPQQVYDRLQKNMPKESQRYLVKVLKAKKSYS